MVVIFSLLTFRALNIKISGKEQTIMSCMKKPELIGPLLGYCNHRAYQRMEQKLRRYGVTPIQCRSLTYLHRQPGPVTQKQLQQHLAVKPSTVNGIVDRLVEKGMLTRTPGEKDGRCRILRLTEAGQRFYDDFESITRQIEDLIHRGMDPQETETLRRLLLRAADNLTSEEDNA
jgi:DNA-binding MarR family transcriptional regulator